VPFDEVAAIVGCTPVAARQHASRARRRVRGAGADAAATDAARERGIVDAFLAAARGGDFDALLALLAPDAVLRSDAAAVAAGAVAEVRGAAAVAQQFAGRAKVARPALIDGRPGAVWAQAGTVRVAFDFTITDAGIAGIELVMDSRSLDGMDVVLADGESGTSDA
jgi:RNA polymerase sigma-70 factor (ECF subfamily)